MLSDVTLSKALACWSMSRHITGSLLVFMVQRERTSAIFVIDIVCYEVEISHSLPHWMGKAIGIGLGDGISREADGCDSCGKHGQGTIGFAFQKLKSKFFRV